MYKVLIIKEEEKKAFRKAKKKVLTKLDRIETPEEAVWYKVMMANAIGLHTYILQDEQDKIFEPYEVRRLREGDDVLVVVEQY